MAANTRHATLAHFGLLPPDFGDAIALCSVVMIYEHEQIEDVIRRVKHVLEVMEVIARVYEPLVEILADGTFTPEQAAQLCQTRALRTSSSEQ